MVAEVKRDEQKIDSAFITGLLANPAKWNNASLSSCISAELDKYIDGLRQQRISTQHDNKIKFVEAIKKHLLDSDLLKVWKNIWEVLAANMQLESSSGHESFGLTEVLRRCLCLVVGKLIATNNNDALREIYSFARERFLKAGTHTGDVSALQIITYIENHYPPATKNIDSDNKLNQQICDKLFAYRKTQCASYGFFSRWSNYASKARCVCAAFAAAKNDNMMELFTGIFEQYRVNYDFEAKGSGRLGNVLQDILHTVLDACIPEEANVGQVKDREHNGELQSIHLHLQKHVEIPFAQELLEQIGKYSDQLHYGDNYRSALKDTVNKFRVRQQNLHL